MDLFTKIVEIVAARFDLLIKPFYNIAINLTYRILYIKLLIYQLSIQLNSGVATIPSES